jgi:hypothetical protein
MCPAYQWPTGSSHASYNLSTREDGAHPSSSHVSLLDPPPIPTTTVFPIPRSTPIFQAWTRMHTLHNSPVPCVHLSSFTLSYFQAQCLTHSDILSYAPTYSFHVSVTKLIIFFKMPHAQISLEKYKQYERSDQKPLSETYKSCRDACPWLLTGRTLGHRI